MIPKTAVQIPLRPLALGERTGHHHSLCVMDPAVQLEDVAQMFETTDETGKTVYLRVTGDCVALEHNEHKTHHISRKKKEMAIHRQGDVMLVRIAL